MDSTVNGKRERDSDTHNGDLDGPSKLKAVDGFRELGIQQLREEAKRRGISSSGSKKELLERLCGDAEKDSATANERNHNRTHSNLFISVKSRVFLLFPTVKCERERPKV